MSHAEDIFSIAEKYEGNFSTCSPEYNKHYRNSDFTDELSWASAWLYQATGENYYLEKSARYFSRIKGMRLPHPWKDSPDWQNKSYATALMLAIHTGNNNYIRIIREFLDFWIDHPENLSGKYSGSRRFYSAGDRPDVLYTNTAWLSLLFYDHFRNKKTPENTDLKYFWYARNRVDSVYRSPVDRHIQDSADDISHERLEHIYQVSTTINQPAFPGMAARMLDSNVPYRKTPGSPLQDAGIYGVVFMNELNNSASGADFSGTIKLHAKDPGAIKNLKLRYYKKLTAYEPARENITIISGTRNILKITRLERYRSMPDVFYTDLEIDHRKLDFDAAGNASIDALFSFHNKSPDDSEPIIIENDPSWPFQGRNTVPAEGVILIVNNQRIWGHEPSQPD